jgi:hypothetical protein
MMPRYATTDASAGYGDFNVPLGSITEVNFDDTLSAPGAESSVPTPGRTGASNRRG